MRNRQLHGPEDYMDVPPEYRLWIWPDDVPPQWASSTSSPRPLWSALADLDVVAVNAHEATVSGQGRSQRLACRTAQAAMRLTGMRMPEILLGWTPVRSRASARRGVARATTAIPGLLGPLLPLDPGSLWLPGPLGP